MPFDTPLVRICGLWRGTSASGGFLRGRVRDAEVILPPGTRLFIFTNSKKRKDTDPDYFLSASLPPVSGNPEQLPEEGSEDAEKKPIAF